MHVCITGANGFLGSHFVKYSLALGYQVTALVRSTANVNHLPHNNRLQIRPLNFQHPEQFFLKLKKEKGRVDVFIHNAGLTAAIRPEQYNEANLEITKTICKELMATGLLHPDGILVYISSYAAYGPSGKPVSHYGKSKLSAEQYIAGSGIKYKIYRPTAIYGPGDQAFLPLLQWMRKGIFPMIGPMDQKITLIFAPDLVATVFKTLNHPKNILYLSDGRVYLPKDLMKAGEKALGRKILMLNIAPGLIRAYLKISDLICGYFNVKPSMTLEKYQEITADWDLIENPTLFHPAVVPFIDLATGLSSVLKHTKK